MKKGIQRGAICVIAALAISARASGSDPRAPKIMMGTPEQMRGAKTVFIDTQLDLATFRDLSARVETATGLTVVQGERFDLEIAWHWTNKSDHCASADVVRVKGDDQVFLVFQWEDCGNRLAQPTFLFTRKFAAAFNKANK